MIAQIHRVICLTLQTTGNILSKLYAKFLLIPVVHRIEGVETQTPKIYVANHPNTLDPFYLLGILQERVVILITEHVFHIPVVGHMVRGAGHIEVTDAGRSVYLQAKDVLEQGRSLLIFSEGEISHTPSKLRAFHTGAVRLSLETGAPIIPIGIHLDASKIWKRTTKIKRKSLLFTWYRYGWYTVIFGKPVSFSATVANRALVRSYTVSLRRHVLVCMKEARLAGAEDALLHARRAKHGFHVALRGVYKCVCFVMFVFFKLNEIGIKVLG